MMKTMTVPSALSEKERLVLDLIVEHYLEGGKPVSSGRVAQKKRQVGSPATVRAIMASLEERGYLVQPHTSAGRVPTDLGLRAYVNHLFTASLSRQAGAPASVEELDTGRADFGALLVQASKILAEESDNLGFVISPHISRIRFHHLRFIKVSAEKVMVILVTPFHMVLTEIVESLAPFTQLELDRSSQYLNQNFQGKTLIAVRDILLQELPKYRAKYEALINKLLTLVRASVRDEEGESRIILQGTSRLLSKAELFDMEKLKTLFESFEEKANLTRLLSDFISLDRVKVLIGSELNAPNIADCSLILSHYGTSTQVLGSLGIIGPKRIPYEKIIPLVDSVAQRLSRAIARVGNEVPL